ncbi:MAG: hypothetical protein HZA90_28560 [Verrucomicrobia bacterium]|nr:hypothetical protein [Verrucomicrobiota bacterium]
MNTSCNGWIGAWVLVVSTAASFAGINIVAERNDAAAATSGFRFKNVPSPSRNDAGTPAKFSLIDGRRDSNGGDLDKLSDGQVPVDEDEPRANFFFRAGTDGGRIVVDLGRAIDLKQINSYSWHPGTRGPQVYVLYASDGKADGFNAGPTRGTDPTACGWKRIAQVDTRPKDGEGGGQHGVSVSDSAGTLGAFRYLLFDISRTEDRDGFGNTFYSEIDVLDRNGPAPELVTAQPAEGSRDLVEAEGGKYQITIDTSETPDLTEWTRNELTPVVREWYPKLVKMLPSEGYEAPKKFSIVFSKSMTGVAATSGTRIRCAASWYRRNLKGEAVGSVVHEMVHVVQQYGRARRAEGATRAPGWLTEGITDYVRFYHFEPQTRGAEISQRGLARARYDGSYRVTGNFLNWVTEKYDQELVTKLNAAIREGRYSGELWKKFTGHTVQELGDEWKKGLETKLGSPATADDSSRPVKPSP